MDLYSHYGRLLGIGEEWKVTDVNGARVIDLPWAEKGSRFTMLFEAFVIEVLKCARIGGVNGLKPVLPKNYNHKPN